MRHGKTHFRRGSGTLRASTTVIGIGIATLVFVAVQSLKSQWHDRQRSTKMQARIEAIVAQDQRDRASIVLLGDSIVESSGLRHLCGRQMLNAGIAGATVTEIARATNTILADRRRDLVIVAAGVNDASAERPTPFTAFDQSYKRILDAARRRGASIVLLNIAPVAASNSIFDPNRIQALNRRIARYGMPVINLWSVMKAPVQPALPPAFSDDGTHPNARGYARWSQALALACRWLPHHGPGKSRT